MYRITSSDEDEEAVDAPVRTRLEMFTKCIRKADKYFRDKLAELKLICPFDECDQIVDYGSFLTHQKSCTFNPEAQTWCKHCHEELIRKNNPTHLTKCMEYKFAALETEISKTLLLMKKNFDKKLAAKDEENEKLKERVKTLETKCYGMQRPPPSKRAKMAE